MKTLTYIAIFISILSVASVKAQEAERTVEDIHTLTWLTGTWEGMLGKKKYVERWYTEPDGTIRGIGHFVKGNDSTLAEVLVIFPLHDKIVYIAYPMGQEPVLFVFTELTADRFTVQNPEHDFPHTISYVKEHSDALVAEVEGKGHRYNVAFKRVSP